MMMLRKEHLTQDGLLAIINLKASINLGLSETLKIAFPNSVAVPIPPIKDKKKIQDPY